MKYLNKTLGILALMLMAILVYAQDTLPKATSPDHRKLRIAAISSAAAYSITLVGLNQLWYKNSPRQSFTFFNDNAEWKQIDKAGHFYSAFYLAYGTSRGLQSFNVRDTRADLIGALTGFAVLVPIEIFDGYSAAYGASAGDLVADAAGALFYIGQKKLWSEVRIYPKFSFRTSSYASLRPNVLGEGFEQVIKDYNGQTYWLSLDADRFFRFPKWLNISVGYGANGMVYARDQQNEAAGLGTPYRQYYFSLDFDPTSIQSRSKVVRTLLFVAGMIRIPSPAVEFNRDRVRFHPLFF